MRVHLLKKQTIEDFAAKHARSRSSFDEWLSILKFTDWQVPNDLKKTFNSADLLGKQSKRVVFNIGGNGYRIICKYVFGRSEIHLFVCWIGTHSEYDLICKKNQQYTINIF
jgi:mRNA interferase HigB